MLSKYWEKLAVNLGSPATKITKNVIVQQAQKAGYRRIILDLINDAGVAFMAVMKITKPLIMKKN